MNFSRKESPLPASLRSVLPVPAYLIMLLVLFFAGAVGAAEQNTTFLPLKIISLKDAGDLGKKADTLLEKSLTGHDVVPIPRIQATSLVDYDGQWPPAPEILEGLAETTGSENVAVGTLTVIGKQLSIDLKVFDLLAPTTPKFFFRTIESEKELGRALDGLILDVMAYTGREFRIASISPANNTRIDSGAILRKIQSRAGGAYNQATLRQDLKAIYAMGYFNDVQIVVTDTPEGKDVVFKVVEKPVISSITYTGLDKLDEEEVSGVADLRENFVLNPAKVNAGAEAIKELYKSKGYYNTQVETSITYPNEEGAVVSYTIDEGKKIYIKKISFEGNTTYDDDTLLDEIETDEKGIFSWLTASGLLEMDMIRQDAGRIVAFYNNKGFLEAKIGEPEISQEKEWLYLTFTVEEGPRFKVGTIEISGDLIDDREKLLKLLTIRNETYLDKSIVRSDIQTISDFYAEQGYAFASVRPNFTKSVSGSRLDINFAIDKKELVYINRVTIRGNNRTRDNVIRRELRLVEGGIFNSKALRESTQALQRLQFFEEVTVTPEPTIDPARMNINIKVKEQSTGSFSIGAGYSSVDNLIVTGSISENNFLGRGDRLSLSANLGGQSSRYNLGYTNPHVNDSALSWGGDLFSTEREFDDYTKDSIGGGLRIGYPIWEKWRLFSNYSYTDTDLTNVSDDASFIIRNSVDLPVTSALKFSLVRDSRNKRFGATKGSRHLASVKYGGGPLGGDAQFTKFEGSTSWYFPLFWKTTFHVKGAAGQVYENETDKLPVYERFYLGGIKTVRGFDFGKISPIDEASGDRIGGDKMWYTNLEFIFPIVEDQGIQGLVFFDAGRVFNDDEDWNLDSFKESVGLGFRWLSPLGPISLVWGYNLEPLDDEDSSVFDFSLGGTF